LGGERRAAPVRKKDENGNFSHTQSQESHLRLPTSNINKKGKGKSTAESVARTHTHLKALTSLVRTQLEKILPKRSRHGVGNFDLRIMKLQRLIREGGTKQMGRRSHKMK